MKARLDNATTSAAAATAQSTADTALATANTAAAQGNFAQQAAADVAAATGRCTVPGYTLPTSSLCVLYCSTAGATIMYRVNGGGYAAYSGSFTLNSGSVLEAYATKAGLTDSGVLTFNRP